ncbi:GAF domain-containing protein [Desulfovibrio ferrophilus]|uniref:GAF sensor protein n=1 Tax=Desulfovibrio ferrophilus TaxID=241368 RepID=A0A2Z6AX38_9BACT|nr:GAF domain-containing protein [Desulfovibrio ferrophilus]BBD07768.1 GAF sensor protein [Desulfovibrio ferrophilus]
MSNQRLYKSIYTIASVINSSLNPKKVLASIAEQVTQAMDAKGCFIRLLDPSGEILLPDASYGLSERYAQKGPVQVAKSLLDQDVLRGDAVLIPDVRTDQRFQYGNEAAEEGLVSLVVVPLTARGDKVVGVLRVYSGEPREFSAEEQEFLGCIANLSGIALENARMFHALKRASELAEAYNYQTFDD